MMQKNTDITLQNQINAEVYAAQRIKLNCDTVSFPRLPFSHIVCIKSGEVIYKNNENSSAVTAKAGATLVISDGIAHELLCNESAEIFSVFASFSIYGGLELLSFYELPVLISSKSEFLDIAKSLCDMIEENVFTTLHTENAVMIKSLTYRLLFAILSCGALPTSKMQLLEKLSAFSDILFYINDNLTDALPQKTLADMADMSIDVFYKAFRSSFGTAPKDHIVSLRLERAAKELFMTKKTVSEISSAVGYDNSLYFSSLFKKKYGICPTDYRKILNDLY